MLLRSPFLPKSVLYLVTALVCLGICGSCDQRSNAPAPDDSAYYPLNVGDYWVYQVTQEHYVSADSVTRRVYQVQERIQNTYSQNNQLIYVIEESVRPSAQSSWKINSLRTLYKTLSEVVSQRNNVPVVDLTFPIGSTTSWNLNAYNANPDTLLQYQQPGRSYTVGKLAFDKTVSVVGTNDSTLVDQSRYLRVYAQHIGLVYRENLAVAFCQSSPDCVGKGIVTSGTRFKQELIASNRLP